MSKDFKGLLKYLGIIFISVFLTYKLPRDSYSVIQYIIKPIRFENSVLYLSEIIPLVMLFIGIRGLFRLEWFADRSKILIFIIVIILVVPIMKGSLDVVKTTYLSGLNEELRSIDLKDVDINITDIANGEVTINVKLTLTDYGRDIRNFKVRMYLQKSLKTCFGTEFLEFNETYSTVGYRNVLNIDKTITVQLANGITKENILNSHWYWETFIFDIYNAEDSTKIIYHGV